MKVSRSGVIEKSAEKIIMRLIAPRFSAAQSTLQ
jgi:hypothetical protein